MPRTQFGGQPRTVSALYGHLAECHSAGALAGIAAVLLTGRLGYVPVQTELFELTLPITG